MLSQDHSRKDNERQLLIPNIAEWDSDKRSDPEGSIGNINDTSGITADVTVF